MEDVELLTAAARMKQRWRASDGCSAHGRHLEMCAEARESHSSAVRRPS